MMPRTPSFYGYHSSLFAIGTLMRTQEHADFEVVQESDGAAFWKLVGSFDYTGMLLNNVEIPSSNPSNTTGNVTDDSLQRFGASTQPIQKDDGSAIAAKKRGRGRPPKNPLKEKRTREPTAYNKFLKTALQAIKKEHTHLSTHERLKMCAEMWMSLKNGQQAPN